MNSVAAQLFSTWVAVRATLRSGPSAHSEVGLEVRAELTPAQSPFLTIDFNGKVKNLSAKPQPIPHDVHFNSLTPTRRFHFPLNQKNSKVPTMPRMTIVLAIAVTPFFLTAASAQVVGIDSATLKQAKVEYDKTTIGAEMLQFFAREKVKVQVIPADSQAKLKQLLKEHFEQQGNSHVTSAMIEKLYPYGACLPYSAAAAEKGAPRWKVWVWIGNRHKIAVARTLFHELNHAKFRHKHNHYFSSSTDPLFTGHKEGVGSSDSQVVKAITEGRMLAYDKKLYHKEFSDEMLRFETELARKASNR